MSDDNTRLGEAGSNAGETPGPGRGPGPDHDAAAGVPAAGDTPGSGSTDSTSDSSTDVERAHAHGDLAARFPDPGLPPHRHRRTDVDPRAAKRAERQVTTLFLLSIVGAIVFVVAYFAIELTTYRNVQLSTMLLGGGLAVALFAIGAGAVHWAKTLMPDDEIVEERHPIRSTDEERTAAAAVLADGGQAAGFGRRPMIWGSLLAALGTLPVLAAVPLWGLWARDRKESPVDQISRTVWKPGMRLLYDPTAEPIKAADVPIGSVIPVIPELHRPEEGIAPEANKHVGEHGGLTLNEMAKAVVVLVRMEPDELVTRPDRPDWSYNGIVAYSKICTHVGCPVALYEQTTHHLLCPCHQSTFDAANHAEVVFGPAARPLPQLAISVDPDGYLIATQGFQEPVGPSFWERG